VCCRGRLHARGAFRTRGRLPCWGSLQRCWKNENEGKEQSSATASCQTLRLDHMTHCGLIKWEGTRLGRPSVLLLGRLGTGGAGEFRVTVEPAREIGAWRLRGGRTRFRHVPRQDIPPPASTLSGANTKYEAVCESCQSDSDRLKTWNGLQYPACYRAPSVVIHANTTDGCLVRCVVDGAAVGPR
jgi:hypothetical protein